MEEEEEEVVEVLRQGMLGNWVVLGGMLVLFLSKEALVLQFKASSFLMRD